MQDTRFKLPVADAILSPWLRRMLPTEPEYVAKMTGVAEVAGLRPLKISTDSVKVSEIARYYEESNSNTKGTKAAVKRTWNKFIAHAGA